MSTPPEDRPTHPPVTVPITPGQAAVQRSDGRGLTPAPSVPRKRFSKGVLAAIVAGSVLVIAIAANLVSGPREDSTPHAAATTTAPRQPAPTTGARTTQAPPPIPADLVLEGVGASVEAIALAEGFVHIATITHQGRSNFAVWSVDSDGSDIDLVVNEIGRYSGVRPLDFVETPAALKIEADGAWRIIIQAAQKAPVWAGDGRGTGSAVLLINPPAVRGLTTVQFTHDGEGNFAVWVYGDRQRDLLVNEIGRYSGETILPSWAVIVEIEADGEWSFHKT